MDTIRLGILGAGIMGERIAASALATGRFSVAAVADADLTRAEALAAQYGARPYGGIGELYTAGAIDAVYIGLPHHLHLEACLGAAGADVHALIDKPLCNTLDEGAQITAAASGSPRVWMMGLSYRFRPEWRRIAGIIASGAIGRSYFVSDVVIEAYASTPAWYWEGASGGGVIQLQTHHIYDRLHWVLGTLPHRVSCSVIMLATGAPQSAQITAEYPGGVLAGSSLSFGLTYDALTPRTLFVIQAEKGMIQLDQTRTLRVVTADGITEENYDGDDWLRREVDEFGQAIEGTLTSYPGLGDGMAALRAAVATTRAAASHGWEDVDG